MFQKPVVLTLPHPILQAAAAALAAGLGCRAAAYDSARVLQFLLVVEGAAARPALAQVCQSSSCEDLLPV